MQEKGIDATKRGISFAQLIGMRDYITYTLGMLSTMLIELPTSMLSTMMPRAEFLCNIFCQVFCKKMLSKKCAEIFHKVKI